MGKSRAEYMRNYRLKNPDKNYRQKKSKTEIKTDGVQEKKIARSSTQRSRDFRARARILSQTTTADPTNALPVVSNASQLSLLPVPPAPSTSAMSASNTSLVEVKVEFDPDLPATSQLPSFPLPPTPSTATASASNTGLVEIKIEFDLDLAHVKQERMVIGDVVQVERVDKNLMVSQYPDYQKFSIAHDVFKTKFVNNKFGAICSVCDRLWHDSNMKRLPLHAKELFAAEFPDVNVESASVCWTCHLALGKNKIPALSKSNGFKYPPKPPHLPELDLVAERLISPRLPFMTIRRLRHRCGQQGLLGQVINVPVSEDNMILTLPRALDDDYAINVHIGRKKIHKTSSLKGYVKKRDVKMWLDYLVNQNLYTFYGITVDESMCNAEDPPVNQIDREEFSEAIELEECLTAQQETLLWDEDRHLCLAPGENTLPKCILFDEHCEELSFPTIYLGQLRTFKEDTKVTPFMMATSELRRADRRGVTPAHLLYMAMKILRMRTRDTLQVAFKFIGKDSAITRGHLDSSYINNCIDNSLAFLSNIPNSAYYWAARKKDLFAMIRQLGKPTFFLTMSANEMGWANLMKLLYKLQNNGVEIDDDTLANLDYNSKATLINKDPVTCAIYFNKLVDTIMGILQSKRHSPFERNYVKHFYKRIEFKHRGSPHAHILLWLNNVPEFAMNGNQNVAIKLIDSLVSVSKENASGHEELQEHRHTFTCYKKIGNTANQKCRFEAPFMPSRSTVILAPMPEDDPRRNTLANFYSRIWKALAENDYRDIDHFFEAHNIVSDEFYLDVLRAGIERPMVFLKRQTTEKWTNAFNPFILNVLGANMDFQFITEEHSCAAYVVDYVNKSNRGISDLQRKIIDVMDEHPEFDIVEITRELSLLNAVEMTSQEAAWFLLRLPLSSSSEKVVYIATVWPKERQREKKTLDQLNAAKIDDDSTNLSQNNCFDMYERRPVELEHLTLAQVTAYYIVINNEWKKRRGAPRIIRYRNYDMITEPEEYKREMVTLYLPFRNEDAEILAELKYIQIYDDNEIAIMRARKEFESNLDLPKTMEICRQMCIVNEETEQNDVENFAARVPPVDPFADIHAAANTEMNADTEMALLSGIGPVVWKRETLIDD